MNSRHFFLCATFAVAMLAGADEAKAQFSMGGIGQRDSNPTASIPLGIGDIDAYVLNETEARVLRKAEWNARNNVDFRVSVTGMMTQYNKSWVTNNQNSITGELAAYYYHTYTHDRRRFIFKFDGIYGMNFIDDVWFKNQDVLKLYYLTSWKLREKGALRNWAYSFSSSFASQFAEGYKGRGENDRNVLWSNFFAPATLNVGAGFTYTSPNAKLPFIITINPVSADALFVTDERLDPARRQALGIPVSYAPDDAEKLRPIYKNYKLEGGSSLNVSFNRTFNFNSNKGVTLQYNTTLSSFYGWMTQLARHDTGVSPAPPAIMPTAGWTNALIFNPLKFLSMEFRTTSIYDRSQINKIQMQYYLRVGLTYRYKNR
jgi:hypothetical protein